MPVYCTSSALEIHKNIELWQFIILESFHLAPNIVLVNFCFFKSTVQIMFKYYNCENCVKPMIINWEKKNRTLGAHLAKMMVMLRTLCLCLDTNEKWKLFYYLAYFCYYSLASLHFFVQFMGLTVLFQLTFTFIYSTFSNKFSVSVK